MCLCYLFSAKTAWKLVNRKADFFTKRIDSNRFESRIGMLYYKRAGVARFDGFMRCSLMWCSNESDLHAATTSANHEHLSHPQTRLTFLAMRDWHSLLLDFGVERLILLPAEADTRFSDPGGMQGWVHLPQTDRRRAVSQNLVNNLYNKYITKPSNGVKGLQLTDL